MGMQEFSQILKQKREAMHISQTRLAELVHVTSQAVSKWECGRSFPDMETLCRLADYFEISLDRLWGRSISVSEIPLLPDDGKLRILQCCGKKVLTQDEYDASLKIPLQIENCQTPGLAIEIWGSAEIDGDITGDVGAGGDIVCGNIGGDAAAAQSITCGNIIGEVTSPATRTSIAKASAVISVKQKWSMWKKNKTKTGGTFIRKRFPRIFLIRVRKRRCRADNRCPFRQ